MLNAVLADQFLDYSDVTITKEQYEEIGKEALKIVAGAKNDYEKAQKIQQWVSKNIIYGEATNQDPYTVYKEKKGICQGYSNLTKVMLTYLNIPCILVNGDSIAGGHAWNMAYVSNKWIFVDSTWGVFDQNEKEFSSSHRPYFSTSINIVDGDYVFTYYNGIAVDKYLGNDKTWNIPSKFLDLPVTAISLHAFQNNENLEKLIIPETIINFDDMYDLKNSKTLKAIEVSNNNSSYASKDGVMYSKDMKDLILYPNAKSDLKFSIPEGVQKLPEECFAKNNYLHKLLIPGSVKDIGKALINENTTIYADSGSIASQYAIDNGYKLKDSSLFNANAIIIKQPENGILKVDQENAIKGQTVTVTAIANQGYRLKAIIVNGKTIQGNSFIMEDNDVEVTAVFEKVNDINKTALKIALEKANAITDEDLANVVPVVVEEFKAAREEANAVYNNESATQEQVNNAFDRLASAMQKLKFFKGDKTALEAFVNKVSSLEKGKYSESSWQAFEAALNKADKVLADENALETEVNEAYDSLVRAFLDLRLIPNKDLLNDLINKAKSLEATNYTADSFKAMQEALASAKAIVANENVTQAEVDNTIDVLAKAIANLKAVSAVDNTTNTQVKTANITSVKTGDNNLISLFVGLGLLSFGGFEIVRKKENN